MRCYPSPCVALRKGEKIKREEKNRVCLTRHFPFCVCRSCPTKSLFHLHRRQPLALNWARNPPQRVCPRTWLRRLPASHSWVASFFIFWKNTTALFGFTPCSRSFLALAGY